MTEIEIVTFDPKYSDAFAELNYAWIKTYFSIEEEDHRSLDHPYDYAIRPGGEIFFLLRGDQVIGTCLLYTSPSPRDCKTSRMPSSA